MVRIILTILNIIMITIVIVMIIHIWLLKELTVPLSVYPLGPNID